MAKKLSKSAKLDLIVSELAKVKSELKKLSKQHEALANELNKRARPKVVAKKLVKAVKPAKKIAKKLPAQATKGADAAPKRPVLIQSPDSPPPVSRTG